GEGRRGFANSKGLGSTTSTFESQNSLSSSPVLSGQQAQAVDDVVRLGVVERGPWNIVLAANYTFQSGLWSGPLTTRLAAPDPRFGPARVRVSSGRMVSTPLATTIRFASPRRDEGQFTLPAVHVLNLRLRRDFNVAGYRVEPAVEVFNVTNHGAFYLVEQ